MVLIWISTRAVIVYKHNLYHRIKLCFVIPLRPNGKIQGWNFQDGWTLRVSGLTKFECDARWRFRHYDPFESRSRVALYSQTPYTNCWDIFWFLFSLSVFFNIQNLKYFFHIYFDILRHSSVVARIATHYIFPLHNLNIKHHTGVTHQEIYVFNGIYSISNTLMSSFHPCTHCRNSQFSSARHKKLFLWIVLYSDVHLIVVQVTVDRYSPRAWTI